MVLICQPTDTRLKGDDRDALGTIKLTVKDLRRILTHGKHFPFLTPGEREEGGSVHWETKMWETCDIVVWGKTRDLGFLVTRDRDIVSKECNRGQTDQLRHLPGDLAFQQTCDGGMGSGE